ncbi:Peptidase C15, pyroglutamyl peptidase I-like protein, partial [Metarhizium majus ARSEF 297]
MRKFMLSFVLGIALGDWLSVFSAAAFNHHRQATRCDFSNNFALSVEEQNLNQGLPNYGLFGPTLIQKAGFVPQVDQISNNFCGADSFDKAKQNIREAGKLLFQFAVGRAQNDNTGGEVNRYDDRPLYWARLTLTKAIKQWKPGFEMSDDARKELVTTFDLASRGLDSVSFPTGSSARRVMVAGFDPFRLDVHIRAANPAGAIALQLSGKTFNTPDGPIVVHAVVLPVLYGENGFDDGIVEAAFGPALQDADRRPDAIVTISQGLIGQFEIERWAGGWRGGFPDNNNLTSTGPVPPAAGWPQPNINFIETTLPYKQMQDAATGPFKVRYNTEFCEWPKGSPTTEPCIRHDSGVPAADSIPAEGSGGDYLSNESMYRANRLRVGLGLTNLREGHLHVPVLGLPDGDAPSDQKFEKKRLDIISQALQLVEAVGKP